MGQFTMKIVNDKQDFHGLKICQNVIAEKKSDDRFLKTT